MTYIFDGRGFAGDKEVKLGERVIELKKAGITPKLVSIIVGDNPASVLYVNLKKKAAERIGCQLDVRSWTSDTGKDQVVGVIKKLNGDDSTNGIMVQLPLPPTFSKKDRDEILNTISPDKDVDGLSDRSKFTAPTAKAVLYVFREALRVLSLEDETCRVAIVGASGFEGGMIVGAFEKELTGIQLNRKKIELVEVDRKTENLKLKIKETDVIISVTGVPGLIKPEMVRKGVILIDVGSPKGDIEKSAYDKASFVSPVPGGVGPITITCLLENLILAKKGF